MTNHLLKKSLCFALAACTLAFGGCKKGAGDQTTAKGVAPTVVATPAGEVGLTTKVVPNSPQAQAVSSINQDLQSGNPQLVVRRLNELLDAWEMSGKARPNSPEDFVKGGMLTKAPTPPPGQRYAINAKSGRFELTR